MELNTALQKLKEYERRSFALYHASGLIYYDGATTAPKGSAGVRAITLGELSRISYEHTTAKESIEMLECLMAHSDELDTVTRRKASFTGITSVPTGYPSRNSWPTSSFAARRTAYGTTPRRGTTFPCSSPTSRGCSTARSAWRSIWSRTSAPMIPCWITLSAALPHQPATLSSIPSKSASYRLCTRSSSMATG